MITAEDALRHLGTQTRDAIVGILRVFSGEGVEAGPVGVVPAGTSPLAGVTLPAVAASVSYVDGVSGGNVFVMTQAGARRLAAAMIGAPLDGIEDDELSELELSAVGEAMNQMMAAAAGATSSVLDAEVEIAPPVTRVLVKAEDAEGFIDESPYATVAPLTIHGEACRLVQLVPTAFVMRMTRALADLEGADADAPAAEEAAATPDGARPSIRQVPVRLSVELGRARVPVGDAVRLWPGAVVELDEPVDAALSIYVNGYRFAEGRLLAAEDGQWAVRIERILAAGRDGATHETTPEGGTR
jgi:flagellar motor switch protein FliN/FliY